MGSLHSDRLRDKRPSFFQIFRRDYKQFAAIPAKIRPYAMAAYSVIAYHANHQTDTAFPSYGTIAEQSGMSRPTAIKAVAALVDAGLLAVEHRTVNNKHTSNLYTLISVVNEIDHQDVVVNEVDHVVKDIYHSADLVVKDIDSNKKKLIQQEELKETPPSFVFKTSHPDLWQAGCSSVGEFIRVVGRGPWTDEELNVAKWRAHSEPVQKRRER